MSGREQENVKDKKITELDMQNETERNSPNLLWPVSVSQPIRICKSEEEEKGKEKKKK